MLTTMVENWPGYRDGIMGPDLMTELRAQAERFGAEIIQGDVSSVDLSQRPFAVNVDKQAVPRRRADRRDRRLREVARPRRRQEAVGPRRLDLRDLRRVLLQGPAGRRHRRRRHRDGRGDLSLEARHHGHGDSPPRLAARLEGDAGQGDVDAEHLLHLEHRGGRHQGHRPGQGHLAGAARHAERRDQRTGGRRRVHRHRPRRRTPRCSRASWRCTTTATSRRTTDRAPACAACSPPATCRITSTARRSPRRGQAAWRRSTRSGFSRERCTRAPRRTSLNPAAA